jgi:hypothetical protein
VPREAAHAMIEWSSLELVKFVLTSGIVRKILLMQGGPAVIKQMLEKAWVKEKQCF